MADNPTCAKCETPLTDQTRVPLWDGRDYCRPCVEDACPGLADYAAHRDALVEEQPEHAPWLNWSAWSILRGSLVCAGLSLVVGAWFAVDIRSKSEFEAAVVLAIVVPVVSVVSGLLLQWAVWRRLRVSARDGRIVVEGIVAPRLPIRRSLARCTWFFHDESAVSARMLQRGSSGQTLYIRMGLLGIPCGWTPEARARWVGFLNLAGVPCARKWCFPLRM